jgi:hypothetical protein
MRAEDGVKGFYIGDWDPSCKRPTTIRDVGHAILSNGGNSALYSPRSSHALFVRKTHQHAESSWRLGKHKILPNEFLGTLLPCRAGLTLYQNMSISRIAH